MKNSKATRDPYKEATPKQREEYNRFGPWLQEIREEADMPPCFKSLYAEYAQARFLIKVPINVDRRDAFPGMELYRSVLAVDANNIRLLYRENDQVLIRSIATKEIRAIRVCEILLKGELSFFRDDGIRFEFTYNAVSHLLIEGMVDFLRAQFPEKPDIKESRSATAVEDFYFQSILANHVRRQASTVPLHCEASGRRTRIDWLRRRTYLGLLVLGTDRDLVMVDRGKALRRRKEAVYTCRTTYIPWAFLSGAAEADPETVRPVEYRTLVLWMGDSNLRYDLFEPAALLSNLPRPFHPRPVAYD